ncbi:putative membrane protein [Lactiplantibacillus pentosus KCA1]|nr:hypothetical protein [Lactiplantibacillus pentosus]EIW15095.1 putative membrane protein [Lactiplantibacillus pentosus KCA1]
MRRQLTNRQRWLVIIVATIVGVGCALLGQWGQLLGVVAAALALMLLTSGCLTFCHHRGWQPGSGMLLALAMATGYVIIILGSYGYLLRS